MPIVVKPIQDDDPSVHNPVDKRSDGFDPLIPYQMIPLGGNREMVVSTGDFKAELNLTAPDVSSMSNFRILKQAQPSLTPLPGAGVPVRRIALPERSTIQFTLSGRSTGKTVLEGRDRTGQGAPLLKPDLQLQVSVKGSLTREVAVCYVFDRVHQDTGARHDFAGHLAEAHKIFHGQANLSIANIDGLSASTQAARTVTLNGTIGKVFNLLDAPLIGRVIDEFESSYPGVFARVHVVLFSIPVPLRIKTRPKERIAGINLVMHQRSTGRKFNILLVGPQTPLARPKQGGPQPSPVRRLRHTLAHELGHSLGLSHDPGEVANLPKVDLGGAINPAYYRPVYHNLMFPVGFILSSRLNRAQIEILHLTPPPFRTLEF